MGCRRGEGLYVIPFVAQIHQIHESFGNSKMKTWLARPRVAWQLARMPTREEMLQLVEAHKQLDDPMETAIWIRQNDQDRAWLVEVIPAMANDQHPERPVVFTAGGGFRYPLHLIGVNLSDIVNALKSNTNLASWVAEGEVLHGPDVGGNLITMARKLAANGIAQAS